MLFENLIYGEITTSLKSVVSHSRQQIPKGRDETECPPTGGRAANKPKDGIFNLKDFIS